MVVSFHRIQGAEILPSSVGCLGLTSALAGRPAGGVWAMERCPKPAAANRRSQPYRAADGDTHLRRRGFAPAGHRRVHGLVSVRLRVCPQKNDRLPAADQ
jgi:hypothetical protein